MELSHIVVDELTDVTGQRRARYGVGAGGAVLIRPDGYIAWRATGPAPTRPPPWSPPSATSSAADRTRPTQRESAGV
ncbi:hypothetical protein ACQEUU_10325 [Nonomuraea sp. CA-218870]|uniref:aromatic-ring hydroxylase C-terminal domain-containing protein n=1 Tax=Nonomuraea sp. CA-218870 TaxID=3239998 RepID=UPI003D935897